LLESSAGRVILDPFLTGNPLASHTVDQIPKVTAVLLTHGHGDHLGDAVAIAKRDKAPVVATYELATYCQMQGTEAVPMNTGGNIDLGWGRVKLVQAFHSSSYQTAEGFIYTGMPNGILCTLEGKTVYHLGDTALFSDLELIGKRNGPIEVALVPIGDHFTMGIEDAAEAVHMIRPKIAVPIHYNTFPPIQRNPEEFVKKVADRGGAVKVLNPGESLEY
jgi:L-ascorbate metabolism protein UlaG (beta-lactamase superfamily)